MCPSIVRGKRKSLKRVDASILFGQMWIYLNEVLIIIKPRDNCIFRDPLFDQLNFYTRPSAPRRNSKKWSSNEPLSVSF